MFVSLASFGFSMSKKLAQPIQAVRAPSSRLNVRWSQLATDDDVDGATISAVECCVGVISACLPTYRPLWNRYDGGRSNERVTKATSKVYGSKSTELKHVKSSENRAWGSTRDDHGSASCEGPYTRLATVTDVKSQWKADRPIATNKDILVTRGFASV